MTTTNTNTNTNTASGACPGHSDGRHIEDWDGSCMGKECTFRFRAALASAPAQPAAQQPHRSGCTAGTDEECVQRGCGTNCPAVSPPADSVQEDAARWHWIAEYLVGPRTDLDDEIVASETINELRKLVDDDLAARKQGEK